MKLPSQLLRGALYLRVRRRINAGREGQPIQRAGAAGVSCRTLLALPGGLRHQGRAR
jgi:hypothetical protein